MRSFLYLLLCSIVSVICAQQVPLAFEHPGVSAGLDEDHIWIIHQDKLGFMWFGSFASGLIRYDGNEFKKYLHHPDDPATISDNWVTSIFEDGQGNFWVGTRSGGLNLFDRDHNVFYHFQSKAGDSSALSHNLIRDIVQDQNGTLWVGTDRGLNQFHYTGSPEGNNIFKQFWSDSTDQQSLSGSSITDLLIDSQGRFWIGTYEGLNQYDDQIGQFTQYKWDPDNDQSLSHNVIRAIREDKQGNIWVGTFGNGLNRFNPETGDFTRILHDPNNPNSLPSSLIWSFTFDQKDNLWICSEDKGLIYFDPVKNSFHSYMNVVSDGKSLSSNQVFSAFFSPERDLWVGTWGGGINFVNGSRKPFTVYMPSGQPGSISHAKVISLHVRKNGNVLVGTEGGGLNLFDPAKETFTTFKYDPSDPNTIASNEILSVYEDSQGRVWLGTRGAGATVLSPDLQSVHSNYEYAPHTPQTLISHTIRNITEFPEGYIWLGTDEGVNLINTHQNQIKRYFPNTYITCVFPYDSEHLLIGTRTGLSLFNINTESVTDFNPSTDTPEKISSQWVSQIFRDDSDRLWIGASHLYRYLPQSDSLISYHAGATGYVQDQSGDFWLTGAGLTRLDVTDKSSTWFNEADDLPSNNLTQCVKLESGEIVAGGLNGLVRFDPKKITINHQLPLVYITDFYLSNQPSLIREDKNSRPRAILGAQKLTLDHTQQVFSLGFSALQFAHAEECQYAYQLKGFDKDWVITTSDRRIATYTNLDAGDYTFLVKATNNDGVWSDQHASIAITILPPFWKTWWAYSIYGLLCILAVFIARKYEMNRIKVKHELQINTLETQRLKELDELKSRLFANISHEFRTPLTLILGPLSSALKSLNEQPDAQEDIQIAIENALRLQTLINQILDLSKLDHGQLHLELVKDDVVDFLMPRILSFASLAESKNIQFITDFSDEKIIMPFDPDKLEKIINNLVSNSIKFTPSGGMVKINVGQEDNHLCLQVKDTGPGIPTAFQEKVFERFFQMENTHRLSETGSGIGLSLTKELVEMCHGSITLYSEEGKGAMFTVLLPMADTYYADDLIATDSALTELIKGPVGFGLVPTVGENKPLAVGDVRILVVEDNEVLRKFIVKQLGNMNPAYHILQAVDGEEGLEIGIQETPDIIIMDWMMPKFTGIELCEKLKLDERTSHIPIILLTARADMESKLQGLEKGADAYLSKPFNQEELTATVKNLVAQRTKLREKFSRNILQAEAIESPSIDELFMQKVKNLTESQLSDSTLNVQSMSHELGMSRSQLFRKVKAITGLSPNQYIRLYRLEKAYLLLQGNHGNVSEIAYSTGFENLSYFTKCFQQHFHRLPSEIQSKKR